MFESNVMCPRIIFKSEVRGLINLANFYARIS